MIYFLVILHGANVFARGIIPWMLVFSTFLSAIVISKFRALKLSNWDTTAARETPRV